MTLTGRILAVLAALALFLVSPCPEAIAVYPAPSARAYCVVDLNTGQVLAEKNFEKPLPPASTTKIVTAVLVLDYLNLDEWCTVSEKAAATPPSGIGLRKGERMRVRDLLMASLMCSANDASVVLAEKVAGSEAVFAYLMSLKAWVLGGSSTCFYNSNGLPAKGHISSCRDLYLMGNCALAHDVFFNTVAQKQAVIQHPGYPAGKTIRNTNRLLLQYPGARGIKTGTTNEAGSCLVGLAERKGRTLLTVVLNSRDRYGDTCSLLDFGFRHVPEKVVDSSEPFKVIRVQGGMCSSVRAFPSRDIWAAISGGEYKPVEKRVRIDYRPAAPLNRGDKIGVVGVYYNGRWLGSSPLVAGETIKRKPQGWKRLLRGRLENPGPGISEVSF